MDTEVYGRTLLKKQKVLAAVVFLLLLLSGCAGKSRDLPDVMNKTAQYQMENVPRPESGTLGGEWTVLSVIRSAEEVPDSWKEIYLTSLQKKLKETDGILSEDKYTEYARVVLTLTALGEDPEDMAGYDLLRPLTDFNAVTAQGINGAVFALLAFDAGNYRIPKTDGKETVSREKLIRWILDRELPAGGFTLKEGAVTADADMTAMVLQALAPYRDEEKVSRAIERGVTVLSEMQTERGTYENWGEESCETVAQVMIALSALEIDCEKDERFIKNGQGLFHVLLQFYDGTGGFSHEQKKDTDPMATDQALCAMAAYSRFLEGRNPFYDMTDSAFSGGHPG